MAMVPHGGGGGPQSSILTRFPVYQIDFSAVASGKRIASTKRRVRWRFGFPNRQALEDGQTGTACRGEEHDVTVVWSITSGKRQITMDGREVHFSCNRGGVLDFSWSIRDNHVIKVIAHASPPLSATPGFRQYDMFIDGQSFFTMPKVYELGIKGPVSSQSPRHFGSAPSADRHYDLQRGGYAGGAPATPYEEEAALKRAIAESLEDSRRHLSASGRIESGGGGYTPEPPAPGPETNGTGDLLDFDAFEAPPPAPLPALAAAPMQDTHSLVAYQGSNVQYPGAPPSMTSPDAMSYSSATTYSAPPDRNQYAPQPPPAQYQYAPQPPVQNQYAPQPPAQNQYASYPPSQNQFAPPPGQYAPADQFAPQADDPFAPKPPPPPSLADMTNSIVGLYGTPAPAPQNGHQQPNGYSYETPMAAGMPVEHPPQQELGDAPQLSMNAAFVEKEEPKSALEIAMAKLVNIDHIDEPAEQELKLTMKKEEEKKNKNKTSALPPTGTGWIGNNASLAQIQQVKPEKPRKDPSEIMSPPPMLFSAGAVNAGALVIHGQGPPPLQQQQQTGFGVGAQLPYGGMPPQQGYNYAQPPPQQYYNNY